MCCCIPREYKKVEKIEDGVKTFEAETWKGFCQLIYEEFVLKKNSDNTNGKYFINDYVWRGQRCSSWDLISYFDREFQRYYKKDYDTKDNRKRKPREYILKRHSNSFAYASRNKLSEFGIKMREFLEWTRKDPKRVKHLWALGQHYGFATPMLDWCYSPFVAAFFAFEERNENQCPRAVWGLKFRDAFEKINSKTPKIVEKDTFEYFDPMSSEYPRLINQRGLFTITKNGQDIKKLVQDKFKNNGKQVEGPLLIKIEICNKKGNREDFLRGLDSMGINHMTIFPDIYGAANFCNAGIEFDDYARFHGQGPKVEDDPKEICNNHQ